MVGITSGPLINRWTPMHVRLRPWHVTIRNFPCRHRFQHDTIRNLPCRHRFQHDTFQNFPCHHRFKHVTIRSLLRRRRCLKISLRFLLSEFRSCDLQSRNKRRVGIEERIQRWFLTSTISIRWRSIAISHQIRRCQRREPSHLASEGM